MSISARYETEARAVNGGRAVACDFRCTPKCHGELVCCRVEHGDGVPHYDPQGAGGTGVQWVCSR